MLGVIFKRAKPEIQNPANLIMALDGYWTGWPEIWTPTSHDYRSRI